MKTLYEKMRDNRSKALRVKTAKWLEEANAKVSAQQEGYKKDKAPRRQQYEKKKGAIRERVWSAKRFTFF